MPSPPRQNPKSSLMFGSPGFNNQSADCMEAFKRWRGGKSSVRCKESEIYVSDLKYFSRISARNGEKILEQGRDEI